MENVYVDCDGCVARGPACSDCMMSVLLGPPQLVAEFDPDEQQALAVLSDAGLLPPLRMDSGDAEGFGSEAGWVPAVRTSGPAWGRRSETLGKARRVV